MMRRGSDLLGKVVVTYDTGERIERVQDVIFDQASNEILGLLVSEAGFLKSARVIPFEQLQAIGVNAIVVSSRKSVVSAKTMPQMQQILKRNNAMKGTRILTTNGRDLGTMVDLYFDEQSGAVEGYEVSGGLFADAYSGRSFVPAPQTLKIGEHFAFVPGETADLMQEQVGGIKAAVQSASETLQDSTAAAGEKLQTATQRAAEKLQTTTEAVGKQIQAANQAATASITDAIVDPVAQKAFVLNKPVDRDLISPEGTLLIRQGQLVTLAIANAAERLGMLPQVYLAAGGQPMSELNRQVQRTVENTGTQLQSGVDIANEKLRDASFVAGEKLQTFSRSTAIQLTNTVVNPEEQKALAIGRVVDRPVFTPDGSLLIAQGEIVTLEIAERAQVLGVLDSLFKAAGGSLTTEISNSANRLIAAQTVDQALGRRVQRLVQTREALIVAAPGQIVTPSVIDRAKHYRQEQALLEAVGLTPVDAAQFSTSQTLSGTGELVMDGMMQMRENATTLFTELNEKLNHVRQQAMQALEERQIKRALGRTVDRIILDQADNPILKPGDVVTHRSIQSARQSDVLDILLNSIASSDRSANILAPVSDGVKEVELSVKT